MQFKIIFILFLAAISLQAQIKLDQKFLAAVHQVETGGRVGNIIGDSGLALGPLQIHQNYFLDALEWDKKNGRPLKLTDYQSCSNLNYSAKVMAAYLNRYCLKELKKNNTEALARCHNSGPNWKNKLKLTENYWRKIEKELEKREN